LDLLPKARIKAGCQQIEILSVDKCPLPAKPGTRDSVEAISCRAAARPSARQRVRRSGHGVCTVQMQNLARTIPDIDRISGAKRFRLV
jgi:hypothetical protein